MAQDDYLGTFWEIHDRFRARLVSIRTEHELISLQYANAQADLRDIEEVLKRHDPDAEERLNAQAAIEVDASRPHKMPPYVLALFDRKQEEPKRKLLLTLEFREQLLKAAERIGAAKRQKSVVLYAFTLWLMREANEEVLTAQDILDNLPEAMRSKFNPNDALAKENLRNQLRKKSRPVTPNSGLLYDGTFRLVTTEEKETV